jgi:hypothetical protein
VILQHSSSADHLGRLEEERRRDRQAQSLGGLEVDDELERRGLLERQVGGAGAVQDLVYSRGRAAIVRGNGWSLAYEAAGLHRSPALHRRTRGNRRQLLGQIDEHALCCLCGFRIDAYARSSRVVSNETRCPPRYVKSFTSSRLACRKVIATSPDTSIWSAR